ncbi:MAG: SDR family NAD(P)-dependent oxidoreductase [Opitutaceae bacterium]|nr:SDR family NAD(P)-dependent oxidoreductase [Opitutaceae bacterium]
MNVFCFKDQRVIISGGGTGIGRSLAIAFAEAGARVRIIGRTKTTLAEVAGRYPQQIEYVCCDVRDGPRWKEVIAGHDPDVLINNAAVCPLTDVLDDNDPSWKSVLSINFEGTLTGCREAATKMRARGGGRIVNITSVHGHICERGHTAYGVAKSAVDQLTRCLAVELAPYGILVNAVAPGFVETPMSRASGVNELKTDWFQSQFIDSGRIPLRRPAQPAEITAAVLFFASKENTYITGQVLAVDGGMTLTL